MKYRRVIAAIYIHIFITTTLVFTSCGKSNQACIPGSVHSCPCLGGGGGIQVCNSAGTGMEGCQCPTEDGGPMLDGGSAPDGGPLLDGGQPPDGGSGFNQLSQYLSGSRIRMIVGTTSDGAKMFLGWYDSALQRKCRFMRFSNFGSFRCYPLTVAYSSYLYADEQCSINVATTDYDMGLAQCGQSQAIPEYAYNGVECGDGRIFLINRVHHSWYPLDGGFEYSDGGSLVSPDYDGGIIQLYAKYSNGECVPYIRNMQYKSTLYLIVGQEMPLDTFPEMTEQIE